MDREYRLKIHSGCVVSLSENVTVTVTPIFQKIIEGARDNMLESDLLKTLYGENAVSTPSLFRVNEHKLSTRISVLNRVCLIDIHHRVIRSFVDEDSTEAYYKLVNLKENS